MDDLKHKVFTIVLCSLIMIIAVCFGMKFVIKLSDEEYNDPKEEISKEVKEAPKTNQNKQVEIAQNQNSENQISQNDNERNNYNYDYNTQNEDSEQNQKDDYLLQGIPYFDIPDKNIENNEDDESNSLTGDDKIKESAKSAEATRYNRVMEEARRYSEFISRNYQ